MTLLTEPGSGLLQGVLLFVYIVTALFVCVLIILQNRTPVKTLAWIVVVMMVPIAGIVLFVFFGQDYRKQKIFSRKGLIDLDRIAVDASVQMDALEDILKEEGSDVRSKIHLMRLMLNNDKAILTTNNSVEILLNGDQTFPAMFEAVRSARSYIHMQFYRFGFDELAEELIGMLLDKASSGVEVRIIFDDVGSWNFPSSTITAMRFAGIEIFPFMPVRFPLFTNKINYRNHRKIMVVDGECAFVGGLNIARKYLKGDRVLGNWRDTHLRIRGEAINALNTIFLTDWFFVSGIILSGESYVSPSNRVEQRSLVQIASSGPDSDWANIMQLYFAAIATAKRTIFISTPYFSPDESLLTALKTTSLSGVQIVLMFPEKSDSVVATWNTRSYIAELLEAGVEIYNYTYGFNHSKYMIVDDVFSAVGSANVDMRSFDINFEVSALVYDREFGLKMRKVFEEDLIRSVKVERGEWEQRPAGWRRKESLARVMGPLY